MAKKRKTSIDNNTCLVTFIIPAYNCRETITQLLNSFDYEYKNSFEVLIIDDGSKVPYKYTITDFLGTYPNTVIYIKKPNGNWGSVLNYVRHYNLAHGKWIKIMDADDLFNKKYFFEYLLYLQENILVPKCDLIISSYLLDNSKSNTTELKKPFGAKSRQVYKNVNYLNSAFAGLTHHNITITRTLFYQMEDLPEKCTLTDTAYTFQVVKLAHHCMLMPANMYVYIYNVGSSNQSVAFENFINSKDTVFRLLKYLMTFDMTGLHHSRVRLLRGIIKRVIYLVLLIITLSKNIDKTLFANDLMYLKNICKEKLGRKVARSFLLSNPLTSLVYFRQQKIIKNIYSYVFQHVDWGMIGAIKS